MGNRSPALHLVLDVLYWLSILLVKFGLAVNALSDPCRHFTPILQLLVVQLVDCVVWVVILRLPPDGVEVGTELRQSIELDRCHLLVTVEDVVHHAEHVLGLFLVFT